MVLFVCHLNVCYVGQYPIAIILGPLMVDTCAPVLIHLKSHFSFQLDPQVSSSNSTTVNQFYTEHILRFYFRRTEFLPILLFVAFLDVSIFL